MALNTEFTKSLESKIDALKTEKVYKRLNYLDSPQSAVATMEGRGDVIILSSNNYLGLCDEPSVVEAGIVGLKRYGAGTASVRFICGTFTIHRELESVLAEFVGTPSSMSFCSAWNANEGLTATIADPCTAAALEADDWPPSNCTILASMQRLAKKPRSLAI